MLRYHASSFLYGFIATAFGSFPPRGLFIIIILLLYYDIYFFGPKGENDFILLLDLKVFLSLSLSLSLSLYNFHHENSSMSIGVM